MTTFRSACSLNPAIQYFPGVSIAAESDGSEDQHPGSLDAVVHGHAGQLASGIKDLQSSQNSLRNPVLETTSPVLPIIGTFHTSEVRRVDISPQHWGMKGHNYKTVSFRKPYPTQPGIPVALTWLDIACDENIRINCVSRRRTEANFEIDIYTWSGSQLYQAGCAWLEIPLDHPDFQFGLYDTEDDYPPSTPRRENTKRIRFPRPYLSPPEVVVWLSKLDMRRDRNWRLKAYATDITATGFTIHIDTWGDSELYGAAATWVSYTRGIPGVASGSVDTTASRKYPTAWLGTGYAGFRKEVFDSRPRVMVGISSLDIKCDRPLRLFVGTMPADVDGMTWYLGAWGDTTLYSAGAAYLALA